MTMKFLLTSAALVALSAPAFSADVVYEEPAAPVVALAPAYTWTGFYIGGQAGAAFNNESGDVEYNPATGAFFPSTSFVAGDDNSDDAAFVGGAHVGFDYQIDSLIIGAVADINYIDASTISSYTLGTVATGFDTFGVSQDINFIATARAKIGFLPTERLAIYATGGVAYADTDVEFVSPGILNATRGFATSVRSDNDDVGYAVGGGVDYLVTQNFSVGLEYLYTDIGETNLDVTYTNPLLPIGQQTFETSSNDDLDFHTVWAKASFRFN
ncbi:outer membrane beta-barrel protein [uncultured Aureimonas sp.]|uniref:outer membrane protein n=1 Tax=uncultured Aureimonas sp. TaxID=1604662 RepID=UPI0025FA37F5|nr:outer membrane beta-barrel protein [uncultured Aureimonas sp.]